MNARRGDVMKIGKRLVILLLVVFCTLVSVSGFDSTGWTDYLGNPQRTAYSMGKGPESPEIFWKVIIPGDFDTPPFIVDNKVFILCKNDMYHAGVESSHNQYEGGYI